MWRPIAAETWRAPLEARVREVAERVRDPQQIRQYGLQLEKVAEQQAWTFSWDDVTLGQGFPGLCLLFGELDRQFPDESWDLVGHSFLVEVQRALQTEHRRPLALFSGFAGVGMGVRALSRGGTRYSQFLQQLNQLILQRYGAFLAITNENLDAGVSMFDYDAIIGFAGIGRYLLLHREEPEMRQALCDVLAYLVQLCGDKLVGGEQVPGWYIPVERQKQEQDRQLFPKGHFNIGLAHGIPGPLALLALALTQQVEVPGQRGAIRKVADWLLRWKQEDEYGPWWPGRIGFEEHADGEVQSRRSRAAWCYGTPGVARALWLAGVALGEDSWKEIAVESYLALFRRPEETWGIYAPNVCHGYAGLLMLTQRMHVDSGVEELGVHRDHLVQRLLDLYEEDAPFGYYDWVKEEGFSLKRHYPGLLEGAAGAALVLLSLIGEQEPEWDVILLSV